MPHSNSLTWHSRPIRILGVTVAVLVGAIALGEVAGWPFLRGPIAQQLSKLTGATADLEGNFRVQLLVRPGIAVDRVTLGTSPEMKVPHLMQAEGLAVQWRWGDLWRTRQGAPLRLKRLEADQIDAHLVRLANGNASWTPERPSKKADAASLARNCQRQLQEHQGEPRSSSRARVGIVDADRQR